MKGITKEEAKAIYLVYLQMTLEGNASRALNKEISDEWKTEHFLKAVDRLTGNKTPAAIRRSIERAEPEDEGEAAALKFLRSIPRRDGEAEYLRVPTGSPLTGGFSGFAPKKPAKLTQDGTESLLSVPARTSGISMFVNLETDLPLFFSKSYIVQRVWLIALSKRQKGEGRIIIELAEYMRLCGLSDWKAAVQELKAAVSLFAVYFCLEEPNGRKRIRPLLSPEGAAYIPTGNHGKNFIELNLSPYAVQALDAKGYYSLFPVELLLLSGKDNKAFSLAVQLLLQNAKNTRYTRKLTIGAISAGLYTAPDERKQKEYYKLPVLRDLETLVVNGIFTRISLYHHGAKITPEEAAALPLADFLKVTVDAVQPKPRTDPEEG